MCPYSVKMAVLTSKITPIEKRCRIFELTKVNLLSLVELVLNNYVSVVAWPNGWRRVIRYFLMECRSLC
ncbi:MAG: hypothetical protein CM15mP80_05630 [Alphaproteobacteria bacterium]|nr:MAG: hypothetical protein CM15mP80_05630 [Alphaproteobacteria bacterium]